MRRIWLCAIACGLLLALLIVQTEAGTTEEAGTTSPMPYSTDSGSTTSGSTDSGSTPLGSTDSGSTPLGSTDSGSTTSGSTDSGSTTSDSTDSESTTLKPDSSTSGNTDSTTTSQTVPNTSSDLQQTSSTQATESSSKITETETPRSTQSQSSTESSSTTTTGEPTQETTKQTTQENTTSTTTASPFEPYEVETQSLGTVIGETYTVGGSAYATKRISRFRGIPYARPPVGSLRFRPPQPYSVTNDTVKATQFKPNCPQESAAETSEDCLYFNVWTVQTAENRNASVSYPVLVWIHGGRFEAGGSDDGVADGERLVTQENAVVVTFNYRVGALGFLTLNSTDLSGNYGILDQKLAIETISEVISDFGGDKNRITLMGLDAGAASIGFHMLNKQTSELFNSVVMMGGSPMMPWSFSPDTSYVQIMNGLFAIALGCPPTGNNDQLQCLQNVSLDSLIEEQKNFTRAFTGNEFYPVIDSSYITTDPWHNFSIGSFNNKDILLGATNDEGAKIVFQELQDESIDISAVNDSILLDMIEKVVFYYPRPTKYLSETGRTFLRLQYSNRGNNVGAVNFKLLHDAVGDWNLACPVLSMAKLAEAKSSKVYMYYFTEKEINQNNWDGASHGVDAKYAFGVPVTSSDYSADQKVLSQTMMSQIVRFANSGAPESDESNWKPLTNPELNYYDYRAAGSGSKQHGFRVAECHFWNMTLAYVNNLLETEVSTTTPTTTTPTTTTPTTTTPTTTSASEPNPWEFNAAAGLTLGILLGALLITGGVLAYFIFKWKQLARVGNRSEVMPM